MSAPPPSLHPPLPEPASSTTSLVEAGAAPGGQPWRSSPQLLAPLPAALPHAERTGSTGLDDMSRWDEDDDQGAFFRPAPTPSGRRRSRRRAAFHWSERDWSESTWRHRVRLLPSLAALLAILLVAGAFAFVLASKAATSAATLGRPAQSTSTPANSILIQQPPNTGSPTPPQPPYDMGVWLSSTSPSGGSVVAFVRVNHYSAPVANVAVTLTVQGASVAGGDPRLTAADGVAAFTVVFGGAPVSQPIFVFASATVQGTSLSAQTTFFPGGGGGSGSVPPGQIPPNGLPPRR